VPPAQRKGKRCGIPKTSFNKGKNDAPSYWHQKHLGKKKKKKKGNTLSSWRKPGKENEGDSGPEQLGKKEAEAEYRAFFAAVGGKKKKRKVSTCLSSGKRRKRHGRLMRPLPSSEKGGERI